MADKTAIRADVILLAIARRVFGADIVKSAYVTTWDFGNSSPDEIKKRLTKNAFFNDDGKTTEIVYDAQEIIIEFCNGNKVSFNNSEWATILNVNEEEFYEA